MTTQKDLCTFNERIAPANTPKPHFLDALAKSAVLQRLSTLHTGQLVLIDGARQYRFGPTPRCGHESSPQAAIRIHDQRFYSEVAFGGSIGAAEAYMKNYWSTAQLTELIRLFALNSSALDNVESGLAQLTAPLQRVLHWLNQNTRKGSKKNITAHYDLGNEFFKLFLDDTMMYSSAIFANEHMSLHQAQHHKLDVICRKLDLQPSDHVLEIGTGWGGFALHAAANYHCKVTTTTISGEQYRLAEKRIQQAGLRDRITLLPLDYRDLSGQFDKLVSIEMIEAVGHRYYNEFFSKCASLLKPDGAMLLQAITIADQRYELAKRTVDFIQRYIFPGSCIPSITALLTAATRASDLRLTSLDDIGPHYAKTLKVWRDGFFANVEAVKQLGYSEEFIRMWEYYLCYCEGGFAERVISDVHMTWVKPGNRLL